MNDFAERFLEFTMNCGELLGIPVCLMDWNQHFINFIHRLVHSCLEEHMSNKEESQLRAVLLSTNGNQTAFNRNKRVGFYTSPLLSCVKKNRTDLLLGVIQACINTCIVTASLLG